MPLNIDWQQILLHLFNFVILAGGLTFILYRPVKKFLEKRRKYFEDRERSATEREKTADARQAEYDGLLSRADEDIAAKKAKAAAETEAEAAETLKRADAEAADVLARAKDGAEAERRRIIADAGGEITDMVVSAAERLLSVNQSAETDSLLYDSFIGGESADGKVLGAVDAAARGAELGRREAEITSREIIAEAEREAEERRGRMLGDAADGFADAVAEAAGRILAADHTPQADSDLYDRFLAEAKGNVK